MAVSTAKAIEDKESFEAWLATRPDHLRRLELFTIAHRCTLRLLPYAFSKWGPQLAVEGWLIGALRCAVSIRTSLLSGVLPTELLYELTSVLHDQTAATGDLSLRTNEDAKLSLAIRASAYIVEELIGDRFQGGALTAVALSCDLEVYKFFSSSNSLWQYVIRDAKQFSRGEDVLSVMNSELWPGNVIPFQVAEPKTSKKARASFDGSALINWYKFISEGRPIFDIRSPTIRSDLERYIALGSTDGKYDEEFWRQPLHDINTDIAWFVKEARIADILQKTIDLGPGTSWRPTLSGYDLNYSGEATDAQVSASQETAYEHELLEKALEKLLLKSEEISKRELWEDFDETCKWLRDAITCESANLHQNILKIYHASLKLTTFLDQNNKLNTKRGANFGKPLLVDESRLLLETVAIVSPWIGRFPTARRKDLEAGQAYRVMTEEAILAHVRISNVAHEFGLISESDRSLLVSLVEILQKNDYLRGVPAEKLQAHGTWTVKNLVFAIALGVAGNFGSEVFKETKTWTMSQEFLSKNVKLVEEVIADAPANVQAIIKGIIQDYQDEDLAIDSGELAAIENRKRRMASRRKLVNR